MRSVARAGNVMIHCERHSLFTVSAKEDAVVDRRAAEDTMANGSEPPNPTPTASPRESQWQWWACSASRGTKYPRR